MSSQTLILVDNKDKKIGYDSYEKCHTGWGKRHRAFVTLLFDRENNVLLQKRKHKLFDNLWDLTAISHPQHINGRDESYQEASDRALLKEMGIKSAEIRKIGAFNYFARDGKNCENEYCAVLVGTFDGSYKPNINEVYETKEVSFEEFLSDIEKNPKKYTRWAVLASKVLKERRPTLFRASGKLFKSELDNFLKLYNPYASSFYALKIKETKTYSPIVSNFYRDLAEFSQGGKKLRAFFVYLGYLAGDGREIDKILQISLAFEMTQNFFLIHDDIMDNSDLRRGKPTVHKIYEKKHGRHYGESMAITLGDVAAIEAFKIIGESGFSDKQKAVCLEEFAKVLLETGYGQALDLEYSFEKADLVQILKIADLKAARYSVCGPLLIGASLAGAKEDQKKALVRFGLNAGLAFQLQDDILGLFGREATIGKSVLSDMREGKNTVLIYKARELAAASDRVKIGKIWGDTKASVKELDIIRNIVRVSGAFEWCKRENERLIKKAKSEIGKITEDADLQFVFGQIADFIVSREN